MTALFFFCRNSVGQAEEFKSQRILGRPPPLEDGVHHSSTILPTSKRQLASWPVGQLATSSPVSQLASSPGEQVIDLSLLGPLPSSSSLVLVLLLLVARSTATKRASKLASQGGASRARSPASSNCIKLGEESLALLINSSRVPSPES